MYSYRFTRQHLFHYFYISIHTGTWRSQSHCHHINCLLVIFFSAVVGEESYILKKEVSHCSGLLIHVHVSVVLKNQNGRGVKNICPFYWTYFENAPCTFAPSYCDYGHKYIQSQQMHTFYLSKLRCGFPSPKINEVAGNYSMHG